MSRRPFRGGPFARVAGECASEPARYRVSAVSSQRRRVAIGLKQSTRGDSFSAAALRRLDYWARRAAFRLRIYFRRADYDWHENTHFARWQ